MPSWIKGFELFLKRDSSVFFIRTQSTSKGSLIIECAPPGISLIGDEMVCWSKLRDLMEIFGLVWFSGWRRVRFESFWQVSQSSRGNVSAARELGRGWGTGFGTWHVAILIWGWSGTLSQGLELDEAIPLVFDVGACLLRLGDTWSMRGGDTSWGESAMVRSVAVGWRISSLQLKGSSKSDKSDKLSLGTVSLISPSASSLMGLNWQVLLLSLMLSRA